MTTADFTASLHQNQPPGGCSVYLQAMWHDAKGDWDQAHALVQDLTGKNAAWVHAYLHRKEGDNWNANYWYTKAGRNMPDVSLQEEWAAIVAAMLGAG